MSAGVWYCRMKSAAFGQGRKAESERDNPRWLSEISQGIIANEDLTRTAKLLHKSSKSRK